jgi:hypothetical protein
MGLVADLATWVDVDSVAWGQRYLVATTCRMLYTFEEARVASKTGALEWGLRTLEPRWRPLLGQVRDERSLGWQPHEPPRPGEADAARALVAYALDRIGPVGPRAPADPPGPPRLSV